MRHRVNKVHITKVIGNALGLRLYWQAPYRISCVFWPLICRKYFSPPPFFMPASCSTAFNDPASCGYRRWPPCHARVGWNNYAASADKSAALATSRLFFAACPETRMDKRSPEGVAEEWRKQGLSGQQARRSSTGAACRRGGVVFYLLMLRSPALTRTRRMPTRSHPALSFPRRRESRRRWFGERFIDSRLRGNDRF
jgi:hypothetical protein